MTSIFEPFVEKNPVSVMARGAMERLLSPTWIDEVFKRTTDGQYTRDLLFSSVFGLMVRVVMSHARSIRYAYLAQAEEIAVSLTSVYNKLNGVTPATSAALVRESALTCAQAINAMKGRNAALLPGYSVRILDGNCLAATEHRIEELRSLAAGPLPGKSLVVFDPDLGVIVDIVPCEDGHTQERKLLREILPMAEAGQVWIEDRNFCTRRFLFGMVRGHADLIVREHQGLPVVELGPVRSVGETETGHVFEQDVRVCPEDDGELPPEKPLLLRRVIVRLKGRTRDGDKVLSMLTTLPKEIPATAVADLYRKRWRIETAFQELERDLNSEIRTLGYPRAALFGFAVAVIAFNIMALVYSALRAQHGAKRIEEEFSHYYLAANLEYIHGGMMVAIPAKHWRVFAEMSHAEFAAALLLLSSKVDLAKYPKSRRGPKKAAPKRVADPNTPHVSTARLLATRTK